MSVRKERVLAVEIPMRADGTYAATAAAATATRTRLWSTRPVEIAVDSDRLRPGGDLFRAGYHGAFDERVVLLEAPLEIDGRRYVATEMTESDRGGLTWREVIVWELVEPCYYLRERKSLGRVEPPDYEGLVVWEDRHTCYVLSKPRVCVSKEAR